MLTEMSGPPPEVIPNIPVRRNQNGPFHLNSDRNFWNLWRNGKHQMHITCDTLLKAPIKSLWTGVLAQIAQR